MEGIVEALNDTRWRLEEVNQDSNEEFSTEWRCYILILLVLICLFLCCCWFGRLGLPRILIWFGSG